MQSCRVLTHIPKTWTDPAQRSTGQQHCRRREETTDEEWNVPRKPCEWTPAALTDQQPEPDSEAGREGLGVWSPARRAVWASPRFADSRWERRGRRKAVSRHRGERKLQGKLKPARQNKIRSTTAGPAHPLSFICTRWITRNASCWGGCCLNPVWPLPFSWCFRPSSFLSPAFTIRDEQTRCKCHSKGSTSSSTTGALTSLGSCYPSACLQWTLEELHVAAQACIFTASVSRPKPHEGHLQNFICSLNEENTEEPTNPAFCERTN